jgi:hypothetical protein
LLEGEVSVQLRELVFTYGCHVWGNYNKTILMTKKLDKLNRLTALLLAPVKKSTPTKGLEIIYDLMPLHLYIECRVSEIMARIRETVQPNNWDGLGSQKGHIRLWDDCKGMITNNITQTDRIPAKVWEKNFKVHPPDPTNTRIKKRFHIGINCYTDGSLLDKKSGCGVHIRKQQRVIFSREHGVLRRL